MQGTPYAQQNGFVALHFADRHTSGWWGYRSGLTRLFRGKFTIYPDPQLLRRNDAEMLACGIRLTDPECRITIWELVNHQII